MKYCVYCHTNKINGKKYIGITSQKPERRWNNGRGYINNEYFYRAILKYGWHNFTHDILYTGLNKETAEELEVKLISEYNSANNQHGYNIELGGNSTEKFTLEICQKISDALKGHECSEETRKKISLANKGRPWTDEERVKCNGHPVKCVETGKVYRTAHEAGRIEGIDFSSICKCVRGKKKTAGSYHWVSAEEWVLPNA